MTSSDGYEESLSTLEILTLKSMFSELMPHHHPSQSCSTSCLLAISNQDNNEFSILSRPDDDALVRHFFS
jgi:hypothetical protein